MASCIWCRDRFPNEELARERSLAAWSMPARRAWELDRAERFIPALVSFITSSAASLAPRSRGCISAEHLTTVSPPTVTPVPRGGVTHMSRGLLIGQPSAPDDKAELLTCPTNRAAISTDNTAELLTCPTDRAAISTDNTAELLTCSTEYWSVWGDVTAVNSWQ